MRAATRLAFLLPLAAIALTGAGCDTGKSGGSTARPPAVEATKSPTPSATPSPSPSTAPVRAAGDIRPAVSTGVNLREMDWANARLSLPASTRCPSPVTFKNHEARIKDFLYWIADRTHRPAYGDLDGDGREEAVVPISCGNGGAGTAHLVVFGADGNRARPITSIRAKHLVFFATHFVRNGEVIATLEQSPVAPNPATQVRTYRLRGGSLVQVSGPTAFDW